MRVAYIGQEALTFNDYVDVETGRTLHAEPGGNYEVAPASGRPVPDFPAPWFVAAEAEVQAVSWQEADPEPEPEPGQEPQAESEAVPEPEHDNEEGQSF